MATATASVVISHETDPHINLALEEWLLRRPGGPKTVLLLYRNAASVVIGRNQNPWLECDLREAARRQLRLARRISGGGTVYHDPGNTNFTFVMPRPDYSPERYLALVVDTLETLGVPATMTDRHAIEYNGRKISGTAFMLTGKRALQHGTMLMSADLETMDAVLTPARNDLESSAVRSVASPVINLADVAADLSHDAFSKVLCDCFENRKGNCRCEVTHLTRAGMADLPGYRDYVDKQRSWSWMFARTPRFSRTFQYRLPREDIAITCHVRKGRIARLDIPASVRGTPLETALCQRLQDLTLCEHPASTSTAPVDNRIAIADDGTGQADTVTAALLDDLTPVWASDGKLVLSGN